MHKKILSDIFQYSSESYCQSSRATEIKMIDAGYEKQPVTMMPDWSVKAESNSRQYAKQSTAQTPLLGTMKEVCPQLYQPMSVFLSLQRCVFVWLIYEHFPSEKMVLNIRCNL